MFAIISGIRGRNLDTETAFTTMAILSMVTHPANMVMTIVPRGVAAFAGFERIQAFLLRSSLQNDRETLPKPTVNNLSWNPTSGHLTNPSPAIQIYQLRIGRKQLILENVNVEMAPRSLTILSGPTGSGKSSLLRAILGEVVPAYGSISLSNQKMAYCAQKPWLPSGSIKQVIYGPRGIYGAMEQDEDKWYSEVTNACCLSHDLETLPAGDQTQIGSWGQNLSGGQRQRVVGLLACQI
jgi:ATP-binding cassette subfamily C (CFTR/MRP) protein 1